MFSLQIQSLLSFFADHVWLFASSYFVLGLLVGSFLNVVIHRLPIMLENEERNYFAQRSGQAELAPKFGIVVPRSHCPACKHSLSIFENIPLVSYLALRGKCSACGTSIALRYPMVELLTAGLSALIALQLGVSLTSLAALLFLYFLIALTFIDLDTQLLPDRLTLALLWSGLLINLGGSGFTTLSSAVLGAVAGYCSLWSVYWLFKLITGKEGMGYGDFKLLAAIGAWLGWQILPVVILLSSLSGAIIGMTLMLVTRRGKDVPIPFGPYLAIAGLIGLLFGQPLMRLLYLNLF